MYTFLTWWSHNPYMENSCPGLHSSRSKSMEFACKNLDNRWYQCQHHSILVYIGHKLLMPLSLIH
jgi:hypothetical protein